MVRRRGPAVVTALVMAASSAAVMVPHAQAQPAESAPRVPKVAKLAASSPSRS